MPTIDLCGEEVLDAINSLDTYSRVWMGQFSHLDLVWREGDTLTAQFIQTDDLAVRVYFSPDGLPAAASFLDRGAETITCTITHWTQSDKENSDEPDDSNLGGDQSQHPGA